ncbi:hypothetical protein CspeluHIS016_0801920 [Cutaneotrichosporon spelunceum]|uniref:Uncharacterized protein n=1 Tax=Cutaneotrichosporon spelunceum TaxID=1672016 RepID=A0AAD3YDX2_9TREE|nr:hypothetical protein CspeluHIS016_0801920 [Cutaneotrichosporon spelunceum]
MQFTPGSLPFCRPNPDVYSDTEERDQGIPIPANRAFPEEGYPKDFIGGDHFANATFPGAHRNLRGLRRTNALHSGLPRSNRDFDHGPGRSDEMIDLRKPDDGSVPHRDAAAWEGGRLADRTGITEQPFRDSPRYRPYGKEADRTLTNSRLCCQPQALPDHHRYQSHGSTTRNNRRSSNSTEEGIPPPYPPKHSRQVIDAMLQLYIKNLPEPERKAFYQEIASSVNQPESALKTDLVPVDPVNAPTGKVIGLLPAPVIQHPDDSDDLAEAGEVDFERVEDALRQLTIVVNSSKVKYDDETSAVMDWFQPLLDKLNGSTINTHLNT